MVTTFGFYLSGVIAIGIIFIGGTLFVDPWWKFDPGKGSVTVRRDRSNKNEDRFVEITIDQIEDGIRGFANVANELLDMRRRIERRRSSDSEDGE